MSHGHSNARSFGHDHGSTHPKRASESESPPPFHISRRPANSFSTSLADLPVSPLSLACDLAGGGLYTSPTKSTTITTLSPFTVTWDNTCLTDNPSSIDIYLYSADKGLIHAWTTVSYSAGSYTDSLQAAWWNNTQSTSLQISIVDTNTPRFLTSSPAGPLFKVDLSAAVYSSVTAAATSKAAATVVSTSTGTGGGIVITTQTASASSDGDSSSIFQTVGLVNKSGGITKGGLAAAIIVPILVIGVAVAIYVRFARLREAEKRKRWSEHIDKRMSTLSQDWRAGALPGEKRGSVFSTGGGGAAGGRTSFAGSEKRNTRASSFMGGASLAQARTNSTYGVENNMAGAGAMGNRIPRIPVASFHEKGDGSPEMRQIGQGARGSILNNNISTISLPEGAFHGDRSARVSFVEGGQPRMSRVSFGDSLNVRPNMGHATKPSVGSALRDNNASPERPSVDSFEAISPSQTQGPFSVGETDITNFGTSAANKVGKKSAAASMIGALTGANKREENERAQLERQRTKEEAVQDWKQAEATRRSNDGLRDMEATLRELLFGSRVECRSHR